MGMFGPKPGSWWVTSKKDPRWNGSGRAHLLFSAGRPKEVEAHVEKCRAKYGEEPADLEWGGMKD